MGARARHVFHERLGLAFPPAPFLTRSWRTTAAGRIACGPIWEGNVYLHRLRLLPAVACGRSGSDSVVRESAQRWDRKSLIHQRDTEALRTAERVKPRRTRRHTKEEPVRSLLASSRDFPSCALVIFVVSFAVFR